MSTNYVAISTFSHGRSQVSSDKCHRCGQPSAAASPSTATCNLCFKSTTFNGTTKAHAVLADTRAINEESNPGHVGP